MNRILALIVLLPFLLLELPGCSGQSTPPTSAQASGKLTVCAGFGTLREWATEVAGSDAEVVALEGDGASAHQFTPNLQDQSRIRNSTVLLGLGLELDPWTEKIEEDSKSGQGPKEVWHVGEWVERRKLEAHDHEHEHDAKAEPKKEAAHDHEHHHGDEDPHVWLDPERAAKIVTKMGDEFGRLDPAHAANFKQRAQAYVVKLNALSAELTRLKGVLNGKKVVTFHDAYGYLLERVGVEVVGVVQVAPGIEPSLRDVQEAVSLMKKTGQRAAFAEPGAETAAQAIAKELNITVATLDPIETKSSSAGTTYLERMQHNLRVLEEHLK